MRFLLNYPDANGNETADEKAVREAAEKKKFDDAVNAAVAKALKERDEAAKAETEKKTAEGGKSERKVPTERLQKWLEALGEDPDAMTEIKALLIKDEQEKTSKGLRELQLKLHREKLAKKHGIPDDKVEDLLTGGDEATLERQAKAAGDLVKAAATAKAAGDTPSKEGTAKTETGPRLESYDPASGMTREQWLNAEFDRLYAEEEAARAA